MAAGVLNGRRHDWVSVKVVLPLLGATPISIKSITYPKFARAKEHQYGTGMENVGYTFDALKIDEGEIVLLQSDADLIFASQGSVLSDVAMPLISSYADIGVLPRTDVFLGVHFTSYQGAVAQGTDGATTTLSWKPDSAIINGVPIIAPRP